VRIQMDYGKGSLRLRWGGGASIKDNASGKSEEGGTGTQMKCERQLGAVGEGRKCQMAMGEGGIGGLRGVGISRGRGALRHMGGGQASLKEDSKRERKKGGGREKVRYLRRMN